MDWKWIASITAVGAAGALSGVFFWGYKIGRAQKPGDWKSFYQSDPVSNYVNSHNTEESALSQLRSLSISHREGEMTSGVETGKLLKLLCRAVNAQKVIDVGVFLGCSTVAMAIALPENGKVIACDTNNDFIRLGKPYWEKAGVADKIDLRLKPATETMQELIDAGESETFDIIFIDADKPNYINYYEFGMQLLKKGGIVVVDNALWSGQVVDPLRHNDQKTITIRQLNDLMLSDNRIEYLLLQISDGIGIGLKL